MSARKNNPAESTASREIAATRIFDAPRELVWKVWTEPQHVAEWWGPNGFTNTIHKMDVRPGGEWNFIMHGPNGTDYKNQIVFVEVKAPERLVYDHLAPNFRATVAFEAIGNKTKLSMQMVFETAQERDDCAEKYGAVEGLDQHLNRLAHKLSSFCSQGTVMESAESNKPMQKSEELVIVRTFKAPRELVWKAWTDPKHVQQWWSPRGFTNPICKWDARPGGLIHVMMSGHGFEHPMGGVFREVVAPERLVFTTTAFEDKNGNPALENLNTVTFTEFDGVTEQTLQVRVLRAEGPMVAQALTGMSAGWNQSLDKFAEFLASIEAGKHPTIGNGKICYIEFPAVDVEQSSAFYQKVFGWKVRKRGDGSLAFDDSVNQVSGTWKTGRKAATEPGLLFYVMVDDVALTLEAVQANGGRLVQPIGKDAPEITARFSDPAGNVVGLYQEPTK